MFAPCSTRSSAPTCDRRWRSCIRTAFEGERGFPPDSTLTVNATTPARNAWAKFERSEVSFDEFCDLFEAECTELGQTVAAREVMPLLAGEIRPEMVEAVRRCSERL